MKAIGLFTFSGQLSLMWAIKSFVYEVRRSCRTANEPLWATALSQF